MPSSRPLGPHSARLAAGCYQSAVHPGVSGHCPRLCRRTSHRIGSDGTSRESSSHRGPARTGLAAGRAVTIALAVSMVTYAATLLLGPVQTAIASAVKVRLTYAMQDRLVEAVSRPTGVARLEDAAALTRWSWPGRPPTSMPPPRTPSSIASSAPPGKPDETPAP